MLEYKEVKSNHSVTSDKFPSYFYSKANLKKLYTLFAWQIYSARSYLREVIDSYKFYRTGTTFSHKDRNYNDTYSPSNGAVDADLIRLAESMNISEKTFSRIFFEWQSKFIPSTTEVGITEFIRLFFKYELVDKAMDEDAAAAMAEEISVHISSWYDSEISENGNVYSFNDQDALALYVEITIPVKYGKYFLDIQPRLRRLVPLLYNVIVPTASINFVEICWR